MKRVQHLGPTLNATIKRIFFFNETREATNYTAFRNSATRKRLIGNVGEYWCYLCYKNEKQSLNTMCFERLNSDARGPRVLSPSGKHLFS